MKIGTRFCKKKLRRRVDLGKVYSKKLYIKHHAAAKRNLEFGSNKLSMKASGPRYSGALGVLYYVLKTAIKFRHIVLAPHLSFVARFYRHLL